MPKQLERLRDMAVNKNLVSGYREVAEILEVSVATAKLLDDKGVLPRPKAVIKTEKYTSKKWSRQDIVELKKFQQMNKHELIRYIMQNK